jgi:beta-galactosidase/beta-glucuronidase
LKFTTYYDEGEIGVRLFAQNHDSLSDGVSLKEDIENIMGNAEVSKNPRTAKITILAAGEVITEECIEVNAEQRIKLPSVISWSPENPFLYDVIIDYGEDKLYSYFAMRKTAVGRDSKGILRFMLNNKPYFHHGLLDQGYWSDGLYTPPTDAAMEYDIQKMKDLGFNTLRKHIKVEPARWYYHCDKIGMLVWQDMVNGGTEYKSIFVTYFPSVITLAARKVKDNAYGLFGRADKEGRESFYREMKEMITCLYNHPSIVMWVPFNEGWGQFDARKATWFTRRLDSTRLINEASGWYDQGGGDVFSIHNYFRRLKVKPNKSRVVAVTEYGGYSYRIEGHSFYDKVYGYRKYYSKEKLTSAFCGLLKRDVMGNIENGLSAAIYTQVSDIEEEVNGIMTYDRRVVKLDEDKVKRWNRRLYALVERVYNEKNANVI